MGILVPALYKLSVSYPNLPHSLCTWTDYTPYRPEVTSAASPLSNLKPMIPLANKPFASGPGDLPTALPKTGNPASIDSIGLGPVIPSKHLRPSLVSNLVSASILFGDIFHIKWIAFESMAFFFFVHNLFPLRTLFRRNPCGVGFMLWMIPASF